MASFSESPCTNDCVFDADSARCLGCHRTLHEVMNWEQLDPETKQSIRRRADSHRPDGLP